MTKKSYLSIYRYVDPVKYLNDALAFHQGRPRALAQFLSGERSITVRAIPKITRFLKLSGTERSYFEALLGIHRAKNAAEQERWMTRAQAIYESVAVELEALEDFRLLEHPILSALLSLVERPDFRFDIRWVQRRLKMTADAKMLRESFDYLLARGVLALDSSGRMCRIRQNLWTRQERFNRIYSEALSRQFNSSPVSA